MRILKTYDSNHIPLGSTDAIKNDTLTQEINRLDVFDFEIPPEDVSLFPSEGYIDDGRQWYVIKYMEELEDGYYVSAVQDVEDWESKFIETEPMLLRSIKEVLLQIKPDYWTIDVDPACTLRRTITPNNMTAYEVVTECKKRYGYEFVFDNKNRRLTVADVIGEDRGGYLSNELNLKEKRLKRETYEMATRILPIGKDGMTISAINKGSPFLENKSYYDKTITVCWEDHRFTNMKNLKDEAQRRLDILSQPKVSYEGKVSDLSGVTGYEPLAFRRGDFITLLDSEQGKKQKLRITKLISHEDDPMQNEVVIGSKIDDLVTDEEDLSDMVLDFWEETKVRFKATEDTISSEVSKTRSDMEDLEADTLAKYKRLDSKVEQTAESWSSKLTEATTIVKPDGTTQTVKDRQSQIVQELGDITLSVSKKVDGDEIISAINVSPEQVKISSGKIYLTGSVILNKLEGHTIDAYEINVTRLNASNLTRGTVGTSISNRSGHMSNSSTSASIKGSATSFYPDRRAFRFDYTSYNNPRFTTGNVDAECLGGKHSLESNGLTIGDGRGSFKVSGKSVTVKSRDGNLYLEGTKVYVNGTELTAD